MRVTERVHDLKATAVALAAGAGLAASAGPAAAVTFNNACTNSLIATQASLIPVTMTATVPAAVPPGSSFGLTNITQTIDVPGAVFVAGYNLGILSEGANTIPAHVFTVIAATNTTTPTQTTSTVPGQISTTITDPDHTPGSGDESATPGTMTVTYPDQPWTAGSGGPIDFREATVLPLAPNTGGMVINAHLAGGLINPQFRCSPGDVVEGANPSTITFVDPALSFASSVISASAPPPPAPPGPARPTCLPVTAATDAGHAVVVQLSCSDAAGIPVTYALDARPAHGTLSNLNPTTGLVTYTPTAGYSGSDSFTYHATSANGAATPATASITIRPPPFSLGKVTLNRRRGTAVLAVNVPEAGVVGIAKTSQVRRSAKVMKKAGVALLTVRARGAALTKLSRTGRVTVRVNVTYRPKGKPASTKTKLIVLKKRLASDR
jgi:hypothetical protein